MSLTEVSTLESFTLILFLPVLVGTSISRLVWCSERCTWLTVVTSTLAFLGRSAVWSTALKFRARYSFFSIQRKLSCLGYLREHLNGPENLSTFVSPFLVLVSVSVWNDTRKISISLRRCLHPSIEKCSQVLCCSLCDFVSFFFLLSREGFHFALL